MTLTNTSVAAAPTNVVNSEQPQFTFYGVGSTSHTSQLFTVDQQPYYLSAFNLGSDDVITVQQVFGSGSGTEVAPFIPVNNPVVLKQSRTKLRIDHPGRYRLFHTGSSPLGTFTVVGAPMVMAVEPFADLGEALYNILTNLAGNLSVVAPITLTGGGTSQSPYVIGFQPNTVVTVAPITISGVGTQSSPYSIGLNTAAGSAPPNFVEVTADEPIQVAGNGSNASPYHLTINYAAASSNVGSATGTDTYAVTLGNFFATLVVGGVYNIFFTNANTGAATLNVNGLGAVPIQRRRTALTAGQIPANSVLSLLYDGMSNTLQIMGAA